MLFLIMKGINAENHKLSTFQNLKHVAFFSLNVLLEVAIFENHRNAFCSAMYILGRLFKYQCNS